MKEHLWENDSTKHPLQWVCVRCSAVVISATHPSESDSMVTVLQDHGKRWIATEVLADCDEAVCDRVIGS